MREDKMPLINASGNQVYIDFPASDRPKEPKIQISDDSQDQVEENIYASGKVYTGKAIQRLEIKNSDIQDVLRLIAKTSGYNIVIGDDVSGRLGTLSLENIPWDQAFILVLQSRKLGYIRHGNVLRVGTLANLKSEKDAALDFEESKVTLVI
jgi:type IV pilus assembly protein PilQ